MGETRQCFKFITTLTKLLGGFPVLHKNNRATFQWCSFRAFYFFASLLLSLVHFGYQPYEGKLGYLLIALDVNGIAIQLSLFMMAKQWPELTKECDKIDFYMKGYGFPKFLKLKLQVVCVMLMTIGLGVYCFLEIHVLKLFALDEADTFASTLEIIVKSIKQAASSVTGWNFLLYALKASFWQIVMLRCCVDIFIISVSVVLTTRFRQVTKRIGFLIGKRVQNQNIWRQIREDYQRLFVFCEKWDNVLGYLVLCSFTSNIYLLMLHLHAMLNISGIRIDKLFAISACTEYFLQCIMICYTAGNVHAEGNRIAELLTLVPIEVFNSEIERLTTQLRQAQPALTGKQLFTLKHSLILQILGGILSHEIILLQYYTPAWQSMNK